MLVMLVHLATLSRYFLDTVVISAIELLQFLEQIVSLLGKPIDYELDIVVLGFILHAVSLQAINFGCDGLDSVMRHHLLLL